MSNDKTNSPGIFNGTSRLVYQQDLVNLKNDFIKILKGDKQTEVSECGYIPWVYDNDGKVDIGHLFPELMSMITDTGLSIDKNGIEIAKGIKTINFEGQYVKVQKNEDGCITLIIDRPNETIPHFNESNSISNAMVKITNEIKNDMIIPSSNDTVNNPYGDWTPGSKQRGINHKEGIFELTTEGPMFASSKESYFKVFVLDYDDNEIASFISENVIGNTVNKLKSRTFSDNRYIGIYISDFKSESIGFSFIPTIKMNLRSIITNTIRFKIKIVHVDGLNESKYESYDMLYNIGEIPCITEASISLSNDDETSTSWCSGVKYLNKGSLVINVNNIENLNNMAAVEDKILFDLGDLTDKNAIHAESNDYRLDVDNTSSWNATFKLSKNVINNKETSGYIIAKNAFGESDPYLIKICLNMNSNESPEKSSKLVECFNNEKFRKLNDLNALNLSWDSEKNLMEYDKNSGLMVIPGKGLCYPSGDWTKFIPQGSPDYSISNINERFYLRYFKTNNTDCKFGGIFRFDGITENDFMDPENSFLISIDDGKSWLSLKNIRNSIVTVSNGSDTATGVLTNIVTDGDKLFVHWAYPKTLSYDNDILMKIGMKQTSTCCIRRIQLLNADGMEDW